MPLPANLQLSNTFGQWINATNDIINSVANTSEYIRISQNATPATSTGNASINGTATILNLKTIADFTANGKSKIHIQGGSDGTSDAGIFLWSDTNWGFYLSQAGAGKSLANGTAVAGIDGRSGWHVRFRSGSSSNEGFLWENQTETAVMHLASDTGNLYLKGNAYVGNSTSQVVIHTGSTTGINASALSTGTIPLDRFSSANTSANGVVDTTTQSFAGNKTFTNNVEVLGYLTVGNNTITLNSTTLILGNASSNLVINSSTISLDGAQIINSSGTANNATYLNGQLASYYTNASNLNSGTIPLARLTSASTTANGVVDTTTQSFAGDKTFQNTLSVTGNVTFSNTLSVTGTITGTVSNATNLNSQPGSYYTNASNLDSGTIPLGRLSSANSSANGVVSTTTQTFSGNKTFDNSVTITGNLNVLGTTTTVSANNLIVDDSLLQLAANNLTSDALDIGLFGNYNTDNGPHEHTGLFRDTSDDTWKLFKGLQESPTTTVNTTGTGYTQATLQAYLSSGALTTNSSALAITANSTYSANLTANSITATTFTGSLTGTASNATNLNSQPGSYYTNASNLSSGTVPLDRLTSASTTANGIVDTTTQSFAGDKTFQNAASFSNTLSVTGNVTFSNTLSVTGTITGTITNATNLNSQPGSYYTNASNISTGSLAHARIANTTAANLLMGNASGGIEGLAMSGDVTISSAGATTIGASKVTNAMLAGSIAYAKLVNTTPGYILIGTTTSGQITATSVSGDVTITPSGGTTIAAGAVDNGKIAASAGIAHSKLASGTLAGQLLVANSLLQLEARTITGDVTISGTGVTTIGSGKVTSDMIANNAIVDADINTGAAIAVSKLAASTISGVTLGNNLNAATFNNAGSGAASGSTYNGSAALTISYNTLGAFPTTGGTISGATTFSSTILLSGNTSSGMTANGRITLNTTNGRLVLPVGVDLWATG